MVCLLRLTHERMVMVVQERQSCNLEGRILYQWRVPEQYVEQYESFKISL